MDRIRVLIADDHAPFRDGLRALLRSEPDIETVGEAATGRKAIAQAATLQPDVILMDLHMPEGNGIEATHIILATSPHISILVLTMFEDDDRSEEHTSELQSPDHLVCRLLLEKKKTKQQHAQR